jgi:hypothetical protein
VEIFEFAFAQVSAAGESFSLLDGSATRTHTTLSAAAGEEKLNKNERAAGWNSRGVFAYSFRVRVAKFNTTITPPVHADAEEVTGIAKEHQFQPAAE